LKLLMRCHRYLSCFIAPAMIFFAVSGAWQAFRLHEDRKDGSYQAPAALSVLSQAHKAEQLDKGAAVWFRIGELVLAAVFVTTAVLGLVMAFRLTRPAWRVWVLLAAGIALPVLLAWATRR
jgi:hypothetical protein